MIEVTRWMIVIGSIDDDDEFFHPNGFFLSPKLAERNQARRAIDDPELYEIHPFKRIAKVKIMEMEE